MKLKCKMCGKSFHHLGSHIFHKHGITAREYKEEFELPFKMALISDQVYQKKKAAFEERREEYLENLKKFGKNTNSRKARRGREELASMKEM